MHVILLLLLTVNIIVLFCSVMAYNVCIEKKIFTQNFSSFCDILKHEDGLLSKMVDKKLITLDDRDEIIAKPAVEKGPTLLRNISGPLEANHTQGFYVLLDIMKTHGKPDTQTFATKIVNECPGSNNGMYAHTLVA